MLGCTVVSAVPVVNIEGTVTFACEKSTINEMELKLLYYRIWTRDVFWLGRLGTYRCWDPIAKHISNPDVAPV